MPAVKSSRIGHESRHSEHLHVTGWSMKSIRRGSNHPFAASQRDQAGIFGRRSVLFGHSVFRTLYMNEVARMFHAARQIF